MLFNVSPTIWKITKYLVQDLVCNFYSFNITVIPRLQNASADFLANVASNLIPSEDFNPYRFSIELIFKPSIPDNITNMWVFNDDNDIINFLTYEGIYEYRVIDEQTHDLEINKYFKGDNLRIEIFIPKSIVKLEDFYDLEYRFKKHVNSKTNSPTMNYEIINLGTN